MPVRSGRSLSRSASDPDLGTIRVERVVSVVDGGRILNQKVARSQIIGGTVGGIGMALLEETVSINGRPTNTSLGTTLIVCRPSPT